MLEICCCRACACLIRPPLPENYRTATMIGNQSLLTWPMRGEGNSGTAPAAGGRSPPPPAAEGVAMGSAAAVCSHKGKKEAPVTSS